MPVTILMTLFSSLFNLKTQNKQSSLSRKERMVTLSRLTYQKCSVLLTLCKRFLLLVMGRLAWKLLIELRNPAVENCKLNPGKNLLSSIKANFGAKKRRSQVTLFNAITIEMFVWRSGPFKISEALRIVALVITRWKRCDFWFVPCLWLASKLETSWGNASTLSRSLTLEQTTLNSAIKDDLVQQAVKDSRKPGSSVRNISPVCVCVQQKENKLRTQKDKI